MAFEKIKSCIDIFEDENHVILENLLDAYLKLGEDIKILNGVTSYTELTYRSEMDFFSNLASVVNILNTISKQNKDKMPNVKQALKDRLNEKSKDLIITEQELDNFDSKYKQLKFTKDELEKKRGFLLKKEEECNELSKRIEKLNDSTLDQYDEQSKILADNLMQRETRYNSALNNINDSEQKIKDIDNKVTQKEKKLAGLQKEIQQKEELIKSLDLKLQEALEKNIEYQKYCEEWETKRSKDEAKHMELSERFARYYDAWNSQKKVSLISENKVILDNFGVSNKLNSNLGLDLEKLVDAKDFRDIERFFESLGRIIDNNLLLYKENLGILVEAAENLTKTQSKN